METQALLDETAVLACMTYVDYSLLQAKSHHSPTG